MLARICISPRGENIVTSEYEYREDNIVLEAGSGGGGTTRKLAELLSGQPGAQLIIPDIIEFMHTAAHDLPGIPCNSVDYLVCNHTLGAVISQVGLVVLALSRFWEVLKSGGKLFAEEERPISEQDLLA